MNLSALPTDNIIAVGMSIDLRQHHLAEASAASSMSRPGDCTFALPNVLDSELMRSTAGLPGEASVWGTRDAPDLLIKRPGDPLLALV
jgi:hypothetical protein